MNMGGKQYRLLKVSSFIILTIAIYNLFSSTVLYF